MKKVLDVKTPHTIFVGKIDTNNILNSSIPNELQYIGEESLKKLRKGKTIGVTIRTIITVYITNDKATT